VNHEFLSRRGLQCKFCPEVNSQIDGQPAIDRGRPRVLINTIVFKSKSISDV